MKKVFALLLTLALVATLSIASFAAVTSVTENNTSSKDLAVDYTAKTSSTVYSVDITWDSDLTFDYNAGAEGVWQPDAHNYTGTVEAKWTKDKVNVKVTNHSNAPVKATLAVDDKYTTDEVTFAASAAQTIATAVGTAVAEAPNATLTVTASGTPTASIEAAVAATVTITGVTAGE